MPKNKIGRLNVTTITELSASQSGTAAAKTCWRPLAINHRRLTAILLPDPFGFGCLQKVKGNLIPQGHPYAHQ